MTESEKEPLLGDPFITEANRALLSGNLAQVDNEDLKRVLTAAIRLYSAKIEFGGAPDEPVVVSEVTPTDIVVIVSALIEAAGLNLWDVSMWHSRVKHSR